MQRTLGIGLAGPGWIGSVQLRKLAARPDVHIAAVHSPHADRTMELLDELRIDRGRYQPDYAAMLAQDDVDAIWIASPNVHHGAQSIAALQAGKHVFCEKPATTTYAEHVKLQQLALACPQRRTFVDYVLYFNPLERRLREMISAGLLGTLSQVQVNYRHPINISDRKAWKLKKSVMGDAISMGINHALSVMYWIFQANGQYPTSVFATAEESLVRPFEPEPIWNIFVTFSGGGTGFCFGNIDFNNGYDAYHNVSGTEGAFVFDPVQAPPHKVRYWSKQRAGGQWLWPLDPVTCAQADLEEFAWKEGCTTPDSGDVLDHGLDDAIESFIESIHNDEESALSFIRTAAIADIGWAAQISALTGERVDLPLNADHVSSLLS